MPDPIARICYPYCELLGAAALAAMIVLFLGVLAYVYLERSRDRRRDRELDLEHERQLERYRQSKGGGDSNQPP